MNCVGRKKIDISRPMLKDAIIHQEVIIHMELKVTEKMNEHVGQHRGQEDRDLEVTEDLL